MAETVDREVARSLLIQAKIYNGISFVLLAAAFLVCGLVYIRHMDGHILVLLKSPQLIVAVIAVFLPAAFFSWIAGRIENKLHDMIYVQPDGKAGGAQKTAVPHNNKKK